MTKSEALEILLKKKEAFRAIGMAGSALHWDAATLGVPEKSLKARGEAVGWLYGEAHRRLMAAETIEAVETLETFKGELDDAENAMVRETGRMYRKYKAVPQEEFVKYNALVAESESVWEKARATCDFEMMKPYYEKIFAYQRRLCDWYGYDKHPYDALLDDYEKGATVEMLDKFFDALRAKIIPLLRAIKESGVQPCEITGSFDVGKQRALMPWLTDFAGYDRTRGKVGEVEHPFCTTFSINDVRITTKYHEDSLMSAIYSTLHESGHALYEQSIDENLVKYDLADGVSMGIHESQSRLIENIICRSRAFCEVLLPKLQSEFEYFKGWDADKLYRAVNIAKPSLIRIEADELTYSLHIMVRYELEKALISGTIQVADLPQLWSDKYEEYLGIRPDSLARGVLQDVHWGSGLVGYFPSYAVGTAYGAQFVHAMRKSVDVDAAVRASDITPVTAWLRENIHRHGSVYSPDELLRRATGESFNAEYYVTYLNDKFSELYLK